MKLLYSCLLVLLPTYGFAQVAPDSLSNGGPISTDRPDQTEASNVVPLGTLQVELGVLRQKDRKNGKTSVDYLYPTALLRYGILHRLELRLIAGYHRSTGPDETDAGDARGLDAFSIGTKIFVTEEKGLLPEIAFIGHLTLPSGSSEFKPTYVAPDFRLSFAHTLSNTFSLGYNVGYEWDGDTPHGAGIYTLSLAAGLGDKWGTYAELFGEKPEKGKWSHSTDAGVTFSPRYNVQFDVSAGLALNEEAPNYYLSAGVSFRLPR
ncbi:transporter [Rufibacter hautae]|uniref:Transporter n=1 Tax=Rufibacter hautae TaxID=2595005 RepID=A0A5B6TBM4_9BACT|nr:transporter [Rufibacter hautae]KAA3437877.1 transporter [Rufibacter hautae]